MERAACGNGYRRMTIPPARNGNDAGRTPIAAVAGRGVRLAVRLTPRAARNGVGAIVHDADGTALLHLRIAAPPVDGAANAALVDYLAAALRLRKSDVAILSGLRGRVKLVELAGDADALLERFAAWLEAEAPRPA